MWVNRHIPEVICTGGYEWLVTVVSIVYLLTFCVFELLGMVSQEFSGKGRTDQV